MRQHDHDEPPPPGRDAAPRAFARACAWALAVALPALAALATHALRAYMDRNILLLFAVAVVAVSLTGGLFPGLLATALSALALDALFLDPVGSLAVRLVPDRARLVAFVVVMGVTSALCDALRRALRRLRAREAALARSEADVRMLLGHASDAIVVVGADGLVLDANEMTCAITGYTRAELVGRPATSFLIDLPDADAERAGGAADRRLRRRDGGVAEVEVTSTRLADGRRLAIARDVTERRRLEARLRQARKMEALGQLAGGVAHDFNNIVAVIRASAELLQLEVPGAGAAAEDAAEIVAACDRATALTRQLLAFSRQRPLVPSLVEPDAVVREMRRMLGLALGPHTLRVEAGAPGVSVLADRGQLEQVLMNLAVNARDAMQPGGTLTIASAVEADADGPRVVLTVTDTGHGMSAETLAAMFEPFFTTKAPGAGTGLGLATVHAIVDRAGGDVTATSALGEGTAFRITLPAVGALAAPAPPPALPPAPAERAAQAA